MAPNEPGPMLYVITCGSPAASRVGDFVTTALADGWRAAVITTPLGRQYVDHAALEKITGYPVRTHYKDPNEPDVLPPAHAYVVAPATFNTVNKIANGISDTLAVGLVAEGIGYGRPVIIVPWHNRPLARHGAYRRSIDYLRADGVRLVLTARTTPGAPLPDHDEPFPWDDVRTELQEILRNR